MSLGKVKWYNEQKGYGFIERPGGEDDLFVHASGVMSGLVLDKEMNVTFDVINGKRGLQASNVQVSS